MFQGMNVDVAQAKTSPKIQIEHFGLLMLCLAFAGLGITGIDFGRHWDEPKLLRAVEDAYQSHSVLPGWYQYPSLTFWIGLLTKYMTVAIEMLSGAEVSVKLLWRAIMVGFTMLSGIWTYVLAQKISKQRHVGLTAAAFVLLSFELLYHSRWIAPDALMM